MIKYVKIAYISALIVTVVFIATAIFQKSPSRKYDNPDEREETVEISENDASLAGINDNIATKEKYISYSPVTGYMMKAEDNSINVYEIYENGYSEKIKCVDINLLHLRKNDADMLKKGISVSTYNEICHMIEDFSS